MPLPTLYLESGHEITDVIEQILSTPGDSIALAAASRLGLLQSAINLQLLQRAAKGVGKSLVIISTDAVTLALAERLSLAAYPTLAAAHAEILGIPLPETPTPPLAPPLSPLTPTGVKRNLHHTHLNLPPDPITNSPVTSVPPLRGMTAWLGKFGRPRQSNVLMMSGRPLLPLVAGFLVLLVFAIWYLMAQVLPSATILLVPETDTFAQTMQITADTRQDQINLLALSIPARYYEATDAAETTAKATGKDIVGTKASGQVTIYNRGYSRSVSFAAGTQITSYDGLVFQITADIVVPAATLDAGVINSSRKNAVPVTAAEVGEEYNIDRTNFTVADYDGVALWAESSDSFVGGAQREAVVVSAEDLDLARTELLGQLLQSTEAKIRAELPTGEAFVEGGLVSQVIEETKSAELGAEVESFTLSLNVRARGLSVNQENLTRVINHDMGLAIPVGFQALSDNQWKVVSKVTAVDFDRRQLTIDASGTGRVAKQVNVTTLKKELAGTTLTEAVAVLRLYERDLMDSTILFSPPWVEKIPRHPSRISIELLTTEQFKARVEPATE